MGRVLGHKEEAEVRMKLLLRTVSSPEMQPELAHCDRTPNRIGFWRSVKAGPGHLGLRTRRGCWARRDQPKCPVFFSTSLTSRPLLRPHCFARHATEKATTGPSDDHDVHVGRSRSARFVRLKDAQALGIVVHESGDSPPPEVGNRQAWKRSSVRTCVCVHMPFARRTGMGKDIHANFE